MPAFHVILAQAEFLSGNIDRTKVVRLLFSPKHCGSWGMFTMCQWESGSFWDRLNTSVCHTVMYHLNIRCSFKQEPSLTLKFKVPMYNFSLYYLMSGKMQWPEHNYFMESGQVGQNRPMDIFICVLKVREPMLMRSSFLIFPFV